MGIHSRARPTIASLLVYFVFILERVQKEKFYKYCRKRIIHRYINGLYVDLMLTVVLNEALNYLKTL